MARVHRKLRQQPVNCVLPCSAIIERKRGAATQQFCRRAETSTPEVLPGVRKTGFGSHMTDLDRNLVREVESEREVPLLLQRCRDHKTDEQKSPSWVINRGRPRRLLRHLGGVRMAEEKRNQCIAESRLARSGEVEDERTKRNFSTRSRWLLPPSHEVPNIVDPQAINQIIPDLAVDRFTRGHGVLDWSFRCLRSGTGL